MERYLVGGALRDEWLGLSVSDRDWVVVGASPEDMVARGYKPVGRDFPVFLDPVDPGIRKVIIYIILHKSWIFVILIIWIDRPILCIR